MAGLGDCGCNNNRMGLTIVSKEKRQAFKEDVKGAVKKVGEKAKDIVSDVKEGVKDTAAKALQKIKTATPVIAMGRGLFILLVKNNYDGIASRIALNDYTDLLNRWYKLGGNRTTLGEAIKEGSQKPERKLGFLNKLKKIVGDQPVQGVGIGKISPALATAVVGLATAVATLISPEKTTGATAGASFGSVLTALLPALTGVLANLPTKADEPLTQVPQTDAFDDGEGDISTSQKITKNLPLILGGLALVGAGIYFYKKKK
jgi:LPXTG-motif cell wall-anchored protein